MGNECTLWRGESHLASDSISLDEEMRDAHSRPIIFMDEGGRGVDDVAIKNQAICPCGLWTTAAYPIKVDYLELPVM
jgi:hypothetical protein